MSVPIPLRRPLVAILAVAAVLFGLLAMHSMTLTMSFHSTANHEHAAAADDIASESDADAGILVADAHAIHVPMPVEGCGGPDCVILGMACVMALLTVALTLLLRGSTMSNLFGTTALRLVATGARPFSLSRPPSLVALSISRT